MMQSVFQPYKWDNGSLIQAEGDPAVYVMNWGKRRLIPDAATLQHHWSWDVVQTVSPAEAIAMTGSNAGRAPRGQAAYPTEARAGHGLCR
jgi:hypothetical protein